MPVFRCSLGISDFNLQGEMKTLLNILLWVWQFPQNLLGMALRLIYGRPNAVFRGVPVVVCPRFRSRISLGRTIVTKWPYLEDSKGWAHEYGHTRQSLYLGPLYLIIIGLPSLLWAVWWDKKRGIPYSAFFIEKWADKLGGLDKN